jgi:Helix-turn-helix of DDE superfamily endonuclease
VVVTLTYLRRNRVQAEIGEAFNVSQSTCGVPEVGQLC